MAVQIRLAIQQDTAAVVELLNEVTLDLHRKGIGQWSYPWDTKIIQCDVEAGLVFMAETDGQIAGAFSIKDTDSVDAALIPPGNLYLYRIAVLPVYQGKGLGADIVSFAISHSRKTGKDLYLDCWAGNEKLRSFYVGNGFDFIGNEPEEDYLISVFRSKNEE